MNDKKCFKILNSNEKCLTFNEASNIIIKSNLDDDELINVELKTNHIIINEDCNVRCPNHATFSEKIDNEEKSE